MIKTAIFIDYDNVNITLSNFYERYDRKNIQETILPILLDKYKEDKILFTRAYLDFNNIKISTDGFQIFMENLIQLIHVYKGKNTSDISLIIDVLKSIYLERIDADKFVIVSSDSDMLPVIKELKTLGKEIELYYFEVNTNSDYAKLLPKLGVKSITIESLLGLKKHEEKSESLFTDINYLMNIIGLINEGIKNIFYEHYKMVDGKKIYNGTCNKGKLRDICVDKKVFVPADYKDGFAIDYLFTNGLLYEYVTPSTYYTVLINEKVINEKGVTIDVDVTEASFESILDKVKA